MITGFTTTALHQRSHASRPWRLRRSYGDITLRPLIDARCAPSPAKQYKQAPPALVHAEHGPVEYNDREPDGGSRFEPPSASSAASTHRAESAGSNASTVPLVHLPPSVAPDQVGLTHDHPPAASSVTPGLSPAPAGSHGPADAREFQASLAGKSSEPTKASNWRSGLMPQILALLAFGLPTICIAVTNPLLTLVDTAVVGLSSSLDLAAMAPGNSITTGIYYLLTFVPMAVTNLVSISMANGDINSTGSIVSEALALILIISTISCFVLMTQTTAILAAMGDIPSDLVQVASGYVQARMIGLPFAAMYSVMQAYFLACRAPRVPMLATLVASLVNLVCALAFVQGLGLGAVGAASATSVANAVVFVLMVWFIRRPLPQGSAYEGITVPLRAVVPQFRTLLRFMAIAGPILGVILTKVIFFVMIATRAATISSAASAGHQIVFSLAMLFAVFGDTVCQAAQAFLPPAIGTPDRAWRLAIAIAVCGLAVGTFNGVVGTGVLAWGMPLFTTTQEVQAAIAPVVPLFAGQMVLHCLSISMEGVLLAAREGGFLLFSYVIVLSILKGLLDFLTAQGYGLSGCWICIISFQALRLLMNTVYLMRPGSVLSQTTPFDIAPAAVGDDGDGRNLSQRSALSPGTA